MSSRRPIPPNQNPNLSPQPSEPHRRRSSLDSYDQYATPGSGSNPSDTPGNEGSSRAPEPRAGRDSNGVAGGNGQVKTTYAKRGKITIVACVPCRKRKTKRRLTHLRDNVEQLQEKSSSLEALLAALQAANDHEAMEIYRRIRHGGDLHTLAAQVQAGRLLSGMGSIGGTPPRITAKQSELPKAHVIEPSVRYEMLFRMLASSDEAGSIDIIRRVKAAEETQSILRSAGHSGIPSRDLVHSSSPTSLEKSFAHQYKTFGVVKGSEIGSGHASASRSSGFEDGRTVNPWTRVTDNAELLDHLLTLYFTWQHSFFQSFPEKLFRADMVSGRTKFCNSLLVNAICAAGCFLSARKVVWDKHADGKTLMENFLEEAYQQVSDVKESTIAVTAALSLIAYVAGTLGRLSDLWMYSGRSALMAQDNNLHLSRTASPAKDPDSTSELFNEMRARLHAFWGCYHIDQTSAFTLGRLPNLPHSAITIDLPPLDAQADEEPWHAYDASQSLFGRPGAQASTFRYCSTLSKIINSTLYMFYAPSVPLSGASLLEEYQKYLDWRRNLPEILSFPFNAPPHVMCLHMYYHAAILLLFRPFLKAQFTDTAIGFTPRDICRSSAEAISELWNDHHRLYGLKGIFMFQVHTLLTALTIHVIAIPSISATRYFTQACQYLNQLVERNKWAQTSLIIIQGLVERWSLILPHEAEEALYATQPRSEREASPVPFIGRVQSRNASYNSPVQYISPTDPATAYPILSSEGKNASRLAQSSTASQRSPASSNLAPSVPKSAGASRSHAGGSSPSMTSAPYSANSDPSLQPPNRTRTPAQTEGPATTTPKRQRLLSPKRQLDSMSAVPGVMPPINASLQPSDDPSTASEQRWQPNEASPANYLYSPLPNQPPPVLVPVNAQSSGSGAIASSQGDGFQMQNQAVPSHTAGVGSVDRNVIPQRNKSSRSHVSQSPRVSSITTQPDEPDPHRGPYPPRDRSSVSGARTESGKSGANKGHQSAVQGLTFGDDWRDPFMGFYQGMD